MTALNIALLVLTCALGQVHLTECRVPADAAPASFLTTHGPRRTGEALDVVLSAEAVLAWDVASGQVLYERNAQIERPIASLTKLLAVLLVRDALALDAQIAVPDAVRRTQQQGADIRLPIGEHATVRDLLAAGVIASANDALVTLAHAVAGSEDEFAARATAYAQQLGLQQTVAANATGLSGGRQYSTAQEVRVLLTKVYQDAYLGPLLAQQRGTLVTQEGSNRHYLTTNKLLGSYVPIVAAKTGYTLEAKENVALLTETPGGARIGIVVLGSSDRFQDAKVLLEWLSRNYTWPDAPESASL